MKKTNHFENNNGLTGKIFEQECFGPTEMNKNSKFYEKAKDNKGHLPYNESIEFVKESQTGDPTDPDKRFANDLHAAIIDCLEAKDYEVVKFYSAINTPMDVYHGVDAFFETEDGIVVTVDASLNNKSKSLRADILLEEYPDPKFEKEEYRKYIYDKAKKIICLIESKRKRKQEKEKYNRLAA